MTESATPRTDARKHLVNLLDGSSTMMVDVPFSEQLERELHLVNEQHATTIDVLEQTRRELAAEKQRVDNCNKFIDSLNINFKQAEQRLAELVEAAYGIVEVAGGEDMEQLRKVLAAIAQEKK